MQGACVLTHVRHADPYHCPPQEAAGSSAGPACVRSVHRLLKRRGALSTALDVITCPRRQAHTEDHRGMAKVTTAGREGEMVCRSFRSGARSAGQPSSG